MKRGYRVVVDAPYIVLPRELIVLIASFVDPCDTASYMALLSTEKDATLYLKQVIGQHLLAILSGLSSGGLTYDVDLKVAPALPTETKPYRIAVSIISWIDQMTRKNYLTETKTKRGIFRVHATITHERVRRYMRFCLTDERYHTAQHWTTLLSFFRLCQLHEKYFFTAARERREVTSLLSSTTPIGTVMHYAEETRTATSLIDMPSIKTIAVAVAKEHTLNNQAVYKAREKYANTTRQTKFQLLLHGLVNGSTALQNALAFDLLKEELEFRRPLPTDPLRAIVMNEHHFEASENEEFRMDCFCYAGTKEEAYVARHLRYAMTTHCRMIQTSLTINKNENVSLPLKRDNLTNAVEALFLHDTFSTLAVNKATKQTERRVIFFMPL